MVKLMQRNEGRSFGWDGQIKSGSFEIWVGYVVEYLTGRREDAKGCRGASRMGERFFTWRHINPKPQRSNITAWRYWTLDMPIHLKIVSSRLRAFAWEFSGWLCFATHLKF